MSLPSSMADFVPCDRLLQKAHLLQERNKHVIYRARSVRMGKNCALGLEYVRPRAVLKTSGTVFSHTDLPPGK